jgi:eukaryotic-like serine/threonine-protein kinase
MRVGRQSSRPSLASLFGWGRVPGSPEEVRAFLQRRLTTYLGFMTVLHALAGTVGFGMTLISLRGEAFRGGFWIRHLIAELTPLVLLVLWLSARRRPRSMTWLGAVDAAVTLLQALLMAAMVALSLRIVRFTPHIVLIMGWSWMLVARAAAIPSTGSRTAVLGLLASVPMVLGTYLLYHQAFVGGAPLPHLRPGDPASPLMFTVFSVLYCTLAVMLSSFVSHVFYGLQRAVQKARQLGQYSLEAKIGEGGMGVVYRGRHAMLRRPTALKLLRPDRGGPEMLARFEREVQLTSQLTHPNTVAIYDYGRTPENLFYYAMEYLEGIDLEALVRADGPQPPARVKHLLRQIAGALAEAHGCGLVHRDIKPSNVMVGQRGLIWDFVKVLDFGLARELDLGGPALTHAGQWAGTPLYMAPEQIRGEPLDGRTDLYAVGALAYYLLTGQPVFSAATSVEVCAHHLHAPVEPPSSHLLQPLPPRLEALVLACLDKQPAGRPASAVGLLKSLDGCDDVPAWTDEQARLWWQERGERLPRGERPEQETAQPGAVLTVQHPA